MVVLELAFDDNPQRRAARPAHRRRLGELREAGVLAMAGPWADDTGALLVFTCSLSDVDRVLAEDPYYAAPGVRIVALREWTPVVP